MRRKRRRETAEIRKAEAEARGEVPEPDARVARRRRAGARALSLRDVEALETRARALKPSSGALPESLRSPRAEAPSDFEALGWSLPPALRSDEAIALLALDLGDEATAISRFDPEGKHLGTKLTPTAVDLRDPHGFRHGDPGAIVSGAEAAREWPSPHSLRGTHGELGVAMQIGLARVSADHALAAVVRATRAELGRSDRETLLTLPTFLPRRRRDAIRERCASFRRGAFPGCPALLAAAAFYLAPGFGDDPGPCAQWAREARGGPLVVLDWGASGLQWGLCQLRGEGAPLTLDLDEAGIWPSLGGTRLSLEIMDRIRDAIVDLILEQGFSEALIGPGLRRERGEVPLPPGATEARRALLYDPSLDLAARLRLGQLLFPTAWRLSPEQEPPGFAPYRRFAIAHHRWLWSLAERAKRQLLGPRGRERALRPFRWRLDEAEVSPFLPQGASISVDLRPWYDTLVARIEGFALQLDGRLQRIGVEGAVSIAACGMAAASPLIDKLSASLAGRLAPRPPWAAPLKAAVNRGAVTLRRARKVIRVGEVREALPYSILIADGVGAMTVFEAGVLDELQVFQRRIHAEDGLPQLEYLVYESQDGSQRGPWGCLRFNHPFEFSAEDRRISVDPRYGFGGEIPTFARLRGDGGRGLQRHFDRRDAVVDPGRIRFRRYAPPGPESERLIRFLEDDLAGRFHSKVFLLEREFAPPPTGFEGVIQRYYLSYSQELLVVREWWAPAPGGMRQRCKELYSCQGAREAHGILEPPWGQLR